MPLKPDALGTASRLILGVQSKARFNSAAQPLIFFSLARPHRVSKCWSTLTSGERNQDDVEDSDDPVGANHFLEVANQLRAAYEQGEAWLEKYPDQD